MVKSNFKGTFAFHLRVIAISCFEASRCLSDASSLSSPHLPPPPDAAQMHVRCLSYACQMPFKCFADVSHSRMRFQMILQGLPLAGASQMHEASGCLSDTYPTQMPISCFPDAFQMPLRCLPLPDAFRMSLRCLSEMPLRCLSDASHSQMPLRCLPLQDASQMPLRCFSDASHSQMPRRCLADASQMTLRCFQLLRCLPHTSSSIRCFIR